MSGPMVAVFRLGYQDYAIPACRVQALIELLGEMQVLESTYDSGEGYVYWPAENASQEHDIKMFPAARIKDAKPEKPAPAKAPDTPKPPDVRVIAAPTAADPISFKSVPPMREFVDEFRHEPEGEAA